MKSIIWGVFLITAGSLLLLERFGGLHIPSGSWWPLILFAIAAAHFAKGRIGSGVMFVFIGTAFLACTFGWFGMSFHHSWPLLMVAVGAGIVAHALTGGDRRRWKEGTVSHE